MPPAQHLPISPPTAPALLMRLADLLPWPLLLLQPDGQLLHANLAGRQLLRRARPLRCDGQGCVAPTRPARRAEFQAALRRADAGSMVPLRWPGRPCALLGRLQRLPDTAPATLLLALSAPDDTGLGLPLPMQRCK